MIFKRLVEKLKEGFPSKSTQRKERSSRYAHSSGQSLRPTRSRSAGCPGEERAAQERRGYAIRECSSAVVDGTGSLNPTAAVRAAFLTKNDFVVINQIGRGAFGQVVLVHKIDSGRSYAMKIVDKLQMLNRGRVHDVFYERNILRRLHHPFIVKLHYTFQSEHQLFFVMDFMEGGNLQTYLNRVNPERRLDEPLAKFYAAEICLGLKFLHENNVVYRDLKPSNVLLDMKGHACLADMGLSKELEGDSATSRTNSFVGTPQYLAPEIIRGRSYGKGVDWWSFGILLFQMLCGTVPFNGENPRQVYEAIVRSCPDLRKYPWVSPSACNLLHGLLKPDEAMRTQGADVQEHPFFAAIGWNVILTKNQLPPGYNKDAVSTRHRQKPEPSLANRPIPAEPVLLCQPDVEIEGASESKPADGVCVPSTPMKATDVMASDFFIASPLNSITSSQQELFCGFSFIATDEAFVEALADGVCKMQSGIAVC